MLYDRVFLLARNRKTAPGKRFSIKIRDQSHGEGFAPSINAGTLMILFKLLFVISSFGLSFLFFFLSFRKQGYAFLLLKRGLYNLLIRFLSTSFPCLLYSSVTSLTYQTANCLSLFLHVDLVREAHALDARSFSFL